MSRYIESAHRPYPSSTATRFDKTRNASTLTPGLLATGPARATAVITIDCDGPDIGDAGSPLAVTRVRGARTAVGAGLLRPGGRVAGHAYNSREGRLANLQEAVSRNERGLAAARTGQPGTASRALASQLGKRLHHAREALADLKSSEPAT